MLQEIAGNLFQAFSFYGTISMAATLTYNEVLIKMALQQRH